MLAAGDKVVKYTSQYEYHGAAIPNTVWVHLDDAHRIPDVLLLLGAGQVRKIAKWVCQNVPAGTAVVEGLPSWLSQKDGRDLVPFIEAYLDAAYQLIAETFGCLELHLVAESQAVPGALALANRAEWVQNIALLLPMGLSTSHLGPTDSAKFTAFAHRTLKQSVRTFHHGVRNIYITALFTNLLLRGVLDGSFRPQYTAGVSYDALPDLRRLQGRQRARKKSLTLLLGDKDYLFPAREIQASLAAAGLEDIPVHVVAGAAHTSLALKRNARLLHDVVTTVRQ